MISEFFQLVMIPFSFPWPAFVIGAFAFACLFKVLLWLVFSKRWVKS